MPDVQSVRERLKALLCEVCGNGLVPDQLDDDEALLDGTRVRLDSAGVLALLMSVEAEFGVDIVETVTSQEEIATLAALAQAVERCQQG